MYCICTIISYARLYCLAIALVSYFKQAEYHQPYNQVIPRPTSSHTGNVYMRLIVETGSVFYLHSDAKGSNDRVVTNEVLL